LLQLYQHPHPHQHHPSPRLASNLNFPRPYTREKPPSRHNARDPDFDRRRRSRGFRSAAVLGGGSLSCRFVFSSFLFFVSFSFIYFLFFFVPVLFRSSS
jgi:hypothetical protein